MKSSALNAIHLYTWRIVIFVEVRSFNESITKGSICKQVVVTGTGQVPINSERKRCGYSSVCACESRLHVIICRAQIAMLIVFCRLVVLLECEIKSGITPKPHRFSGSHQTYLVVLL